MRTLLRLTALASIVSVLSPGGSPRLGAESAPAPVPPPTMAPATGSLLSQVAPGQPPAAPPLASAEASFPSAEALASESAAASNDTWGEAFFDPEHGIRGYFPRGWKMRDSIHWDKEEVGLIFAVTEHPLANPVLYYRKLPSRPTRLSDKQITEWLFQEAVSKTKQRINEGLKDYKSRKSMYRRVGQRPALTWLADYTRYGQRWIEYLTRIYSPEGTALLTISAPADDMARLMPQFEAMILSTTIP